jgi:hypothetical protein
VILVFIDATNEAPVDLQVADFQRVQIRDLG